MQIHFFLPFFPFPIKPVPGPFQQGERSLVPARESLGCGSVPSDQALWAAHLLWEGGIHRGQLCSSSPSCQRGHSSSLWHRGPGWQQPCQGGEPGSCWPRGLHSRRGVTLTPQRLYRNCFCFLTVSATSLCNIQVINLYNRVAVRLPTYFIILIWNKFHYHRFPEGFVLERTLMIIS